MTTSTTPENPASAPPPTDALEARANGALAVRPGDWLSTRRMLGGGVPGMDSPARRRSLAARFASPASLRETLEAARARGFERMATIGDRRLFEATGRRFAGGVPRPVPIVPNIQGFMREAVEHGLAGAGLARLRRVGPLPLAGLALRGVGRVPALAARDFPTMLLCFIELELADFRAADPSHVLLQAQMTDLALAMDNPRILLAFAGAIRRRTGARPGFMTRNFAALADALGRWGIEAGAIVAPWAADGFQMRPDAATCEAALERARARSRAATGAGALLLVGDRSGFPDAPSEEDRRAADRAGAVGHLRDDDEALGLAGAREASRLRGTRAELGRAL